MHFLLLLHDAARAPSPKAFSGAGTGAAGAAIVCKCAAFSSADIGREGEEKT
jgi:hypothetical protein